jgi:ABC-type iron transport system FetAB permease component
VVNMEITQTLALALVTITTTIAAIKGRRNPALITASISAWILLFFTVYFDPTTVIVNGKNPLTTLFFEAIITFITIVAEIVGIYEMQHHN